MINYISNIIRQNVQITSVLFTMKKKAVIAKYEEYLKRLSHTSKMIQNTKTALKILKIYKSKDIYISLKKKKEDREFNEQKKYFQESNKLQDIDKEITEYNRIIQGKHSIDKETLELLETLYKEDDNQYVINMMNGFLISFIKYILEHNHYDLGSDAYYKSCGTEDIYCSKIYIISQKGDVIIKDNKDKIIELTGSKFIKILKERHYILLSKIITTYQYNHNINKILDVVINQYSA